MREFTVSLTELEAQVIEIALEDYAGIIEEGIHLNKEQAVKAVENLLLVAYKIKLARLNNEQKDEANVS